MDLHQLWTIVSLPDNVPIVLLMIVVPFYTWYAMRQAFANDRLIGELEASLRQKSSHSDRLITSARRDVKAQICDAGHKPRGIDPRRSDLDLYLN